MSEGSSPPFPLSGTAPDPLHVLVVGGSLAGSLAALALARSGHTLTVLERGRDLQRTGAALGGVDVAEVERVTGVHLTGSAPARGHLPLSWADVHRQLRAAVGAQPGIAFHPRSSVTAVGQTATVAWARTDAGETHEADVLLGADGIRSVVRGLVDPEHAEARFAGYLIWLGVVDEADLAAGTRWPRDVDILASGRDYLLGYPLPAPDGTHAVGTRRLGWAWYDASRTRLLRTSGAVEAGTVRHSLSGEEVPRDVLTELADTAGRWPAPWSGAIRATVAQGQVTGTPIAEHLPAALVSGRIALVGDAAHLPTPMTGNGFDASLRDAATLQELLVGCAPDGVDAALEAYEVLRLPEVRDIVAGGQQFSRGFSGR